jgi:predicted DNA-binding protein with PD1-like motif
MDLNGSFMPGRLFFQQLPSAEPLLDAIVSVCRHHDLSAATFSLTGALSCVTVGTFDQQQQVYVTLTEETSLEILSCTGTVCIQEGDPELSATILVSDITGKIIGGRLFSPTHGEAVHLMLQELIAPPSRCGDPIDQDVPCRKHPGQPPATERNPSP